MSKSGKKAGQKLNRQKTSKADLCDVTLYDFANSSVAGASGRLKKNSDLVNQVVKEVKNLNLVEDNQTWEKKLKNLETAFKKNKIGRPQAVKKPTFYRRKRTITNKTVETRTGNDYPIDIWFLISEYISPEDVGKFAAICKTSLAVVSTAKFWFNLYKRYYRSVADLPEQLQPKCMERPYGLRTHVIRALHFMYPPFIEKLQLQLSSDGDPHPLINRLCVLAWSQEIKNHWLFSFKLKEVTSTRYGIRNEEAKKKPDALEMLEDITANHDNDCKVLQVTCLNYINLPMLSGQILSDVFLKVSRRMNRRLQLNFGSGPFPKQSSSPVIFDSIVNIQVLDWWHPSFPHSYCLSTSLFSAAFDNKQFDELDY